MISGATHRAVFQSTSDFPFAHSALWESLVQRCIFSAFPQGDGVHAWSCLTLCNPMDYSPPASSVMGILQASILEWVAMPSSRGSSQPRDRTQVSHTAVRFFTIWDTREAQEYCTGVGSLIPSPGDLPDPGIKPGSPAFQTGSLPIELPEKPKLNYT